MLVHEEVLLGSNLPMEVRVPLVGAPPLPPWAVLSKVRRRRDND